MDHVQELLHKEEVLTKDEEHEVFTYYNEHPSKELKNQIVEKNMGLVNKIANRYKNYGYEEEDLFQEGIFGLMIAVDRFDPEYGTKFSTYAVQWINQAISRYIANTKQNIRLPVHVSEDIRKMIKYIQAYEQKYHSEPDNAYLAEQMGVDEEKITELKTIMRNLQTASLSAFVGTEEDAELEDFIPDSSIDVEKEVIKKMQNEELRKIMKEKLSDREYKIICMRFGFDGQDPMTLEQVGNEFGVTRERIRQIEDKSLRKLRRCRDIGRLQYG